MARICVDFSMIIVADPRPYDLFLFQSFFALPLHLPFFAFSSLSFALSSFVFLFLTFSLFPLVLCLQSFIPHLLSSPVHLRLDSALRSFLSLSLFHFLFLSVSLLSICLRAIEMKRTHMNAIPKSIPVKWSVLACPGFRSRSSFCTQSVTFAIQVDLVQLNGHT